MDGVFFNGVFGSGCCWVWGVGYIARDIGWRNSGVRAIKVAASKVYICCSFDSDIHKEEEAIHMASGESEERRATSDERRAKDRKEKQNSG